MATARADVLLVGGGVASVRCARAVRRLGFDGSILLVGAEPVLPYNRPPLSKELLRGDLGDELVLAESESWYRRRAIDVRTGVGVVEFDVADRVAHLADESSVAFDRCLLATGAEPRRLPVPGGEHAMELRTLPDARRIAAAAAEAGAGAWATVIGGGFIGVEVASGLAVLGLRPTVVEMADTLWAGSLGTELASWARDRLEEAGVEVRTGVAVTSLSPEGGIAGDDELPHAFAVAGIGVAPRVELAQAAGLATDDGIITDAEQRTSHPAVWAAGDVARVAGRRVEHWHSAREAGERAALSMLGLPVPPPPTPWFFSEVAGTTIDVYGAADGWEEERWIGDSVVAFVDAGRVVQLAVIGSAIEAITARDLVQRRVVATAVEGAMGGS